MRVDVSVDVTCDECGCKVWGVGGVWVWGECWIWVGVGEWNVFEYGWRA